MGQVHIKTKIIPLVVNEWSPETATLKPDLTSMPMWIDLRRVPSHLFSAKGLKCLARGVGKFVKLHPSTERCIRLDVARLLVEVNRHKELVERIDFQDANGEKVTIELCYPWLPPKCSVCKAWGHKGLECTSTQVKILKVQSGKGKEICTSESNEVAEVGVRQNQNVVGKLLQELENVAVQKSTEVGSSSDQLIEVYGEGTRCGDNTDLLLNAEGSVEAFVFDRTEQKQWSLVQTGSTYNKATSKTGEGTSNGITVSPSRFNVLAVSEDEGEIDDIEEGELVPVVTKTEVTREMKRGGKVQQSAVSSLLSIKTPERKL
ncbi:hypothetical protein F2Q70_00018850 [Brassica cretica]|uniref:DUF4283 domain-containing protein n=1 Tax=Brassica cretica TaxID=69181 RepID=A0A8S9HW83_BRACR|nr:hypothetical protein F2Q70_00018850 [Brassica cretica]